MIPTLNPKFLESLKNFEKTKIGEKKRKNKIGILIDIRCVPDSSVGKEAACNEGDCSLIPGLGRSPGEGKGYPLQYSGLENSMDSPWGLKELDMSE